MSQTLQRTYTDRKITPEEARRLVAEMKRQGLMSVRPPNAAELAAVRAMERGHKNTFMQGVGTTEEMSRRAARAVAGRQAPRVASAVRHARQTLGVGPGGIDVQDSDRPLVTNKGSGAPKIVAMPDQVVGINAQTGLSALQE